MPLTPELVEAVTTHNIADARQQLSALTPAELQAEPGLVLLEIAVSKNDIAMIDLLTQAGVPSTTLLHIAAKLNATNVLSHYLQAGMSWNARDPFNQTPLHVAILNQHLEASKILLENGARIHRHENGFSMIRDNCWMTPWRLARLINNPDLIKLLEAKISDEDKKEEMDIKLMWYTALEKERTELLGILLPHWNMERRGEGGNTALHKAVIAGSLQLVKWLVEHGAAVNADDISGFTPLFHAVIAGNVEKVRYLMDHGADPSSKDLTGHTVFNYIPVDKRAALLPLLSQNQDPSLTQVQYIELIDVNQFNLGQQLGRFLEMTGRNSSSVLKKSGNCGGFEFFYMFLRNLTGDNRLYYEIVNTIMSWDGNETSLYNIELPEKFKPFMIAFKEEKTGIKHEKSLASLLEFVTYFIAMAQAGSNLFISMNIPLPSTFVQYNRPELFDFIKPVNSNMEVRTLFGYFEREFSYLQVVEMLQIFSAWRGITVAIYAQGGVGHTTSVYITPEGTFEYFDPNHRYKILPFDSAEALAKHFYDFLFKKPDPNENIAISFAGFQYRLANNPAITQAAGDLKYPDDSANAFTALHRAVLYHDDSKITMLLHSPDAPDLLDDVDVQGYYAGALAVAANFYEGFFKIFQNQVKHQLTDSIDATVGYLFAFAFTHKDVNKLRWMRRIVTEYGFDMTNIQKFIDHYREYIYDYFRFAIQDNNHDLLDLLIQIRMDVNLQDSQSPHHSVLHLAALTDDPSSITKLIKAGADLNALNRTHDTPFLSAMSRSKFESAKCLLKFGADVNHVDANGYGALYYAMNMEDPQLRQQILTLLIHYKINLDVEDQNQQKILDAAKPEVQIEIQQILEKRAQSETLKSASKSHQQRKNFLPSTKENFLPSSKPISTQDKPKSKKGFPH